MRSQKIVSMMDIDPMGRIVSGSESAIRASIEQWSALPVDMTMLGPTGAPPAEHQTTLSQGFSVTGPGTYSGKQARTLHIEPSSVEGWWIDRTDQQEQLPIRVSVRNVWTTVRSIVLRSGAPHNYLRMVEHIVALRLGLGLDNALVKIDSGDPPLFEVGSQDIVDGIQQAGIVETDAPLTYWAVKEPVMIGGSGGSFLSIHPPEENGRTLSIDCAIDFPTAIGRQRIQFDLCRDSFVHGARARTNCAVVMMLFVKTIGKLFADTRSLGYSPKNILIAGRKSYFNEPKLVHEGKSLEAVWHRACLDLIAALSLIETGRLAGRIFSYKAGHALDVNMVTHLYLQGLLEPIR